MEGDRVLQQVENLDDGIAIEMEVAVTAQLGQAVGSGGPVPRVQVKGCEIVDRSGDSGATEDSFESNRTAEQSLDSISELR